MAPTLLFLVYLAIFLSSLLFLKTFVFGRSSSAIAGRTSKNAATKPKLPPSGPPALPVVGHLYLFKKPLHQYMRRLSDRYGDVLLLRFGSRKVLLVSSLASAEECFTKNDAAFASRPQLPTSKGLNYDYATVGAAPYGPHWRNVRRIVTSEVLSPHRLASFSDLRADEVRLMASEIFRRTGGGGGGARVELKSRLFGLTLNLMMRMIAGKRYYGEVGVDDLDGAARFMKVMEEVFAYLGASNVGDFVPALRLLDFRTRREVARLEKVMDGFLQELIEKQRKKEVGAAAGDDKEPANLIGVLLSLQKNDPDYYTDTIIKAIIITLLSAGTDTTSDTMEWAMSLLLNNPLCLNKAKSEIAAVVGVDRLLRESDVPNLPYLRAVVAETLRLYPAGPMLVPHHSTDDCSVSGHIVPAGTMLLVNAYAIHRDNAAWGPDAAQFRPERFLADSGGAGGGDHHGRPMMPFGMGRRRCPGEAHAARVMPLALGTLLQCFEWRRVGKEEVDMEEGEGLTLPKKNPLVAVCSPSTSMITVLSNI